MNLLTKDELKALLEVEKENCLSIYMPAHQAGPATRQDPIRLKNLIGQAEEKLVAKDLRSAEVEQLLQPAKELVEQHSFWQHQSDGLALFMAPGIFYYYRLPLNFEELVVVTNRFHLKPLMPLFTGNGQFYLLALSQNQIRLFQGGQYSISEVELSDVPQSLAEALQYDVPEKQLQFHSGTPGGTSERGRAAIYHGQGVGTTDDKEEIWRYFQKVDKGLQSFLSDEQIPLVLAGVEYLIPIYKEANSYSPLLEEAILGNPDELKPEQLHQQAWEIVQPHFQQVQQQATNKYQELVGTGQASSNLEKVVSAAYHGQIDTLFVRVDQQRWGKFNPDKNQLELHSQPEPGDEDLLDFSSVHTFEQGGKVYACEANHLPEDAPLAAVFRYPLAG